ncbi:NADH:flavin oxidoreductase/NADH oxidase [Methylobacterium oryzihabitans]|uniref:NADH:flavin oxidoreductase/NADH oxidase n=1 Tax=Methylobacterium oryzihabitans TaxID=2499852 RepID=A0A3S2V706_9HYPH|nr:NADH:flavin oxidoreductase/NADH oxidase [Methylobacterium oryzihabitans]RVU15974.1 NADH:flavin oxidoreductase/NADH oxidase [Methylobacterium oryzihabitans]
MPDGTLLFSPLRLREVTFPNRIVIAPMQMYKARPDGLASDWHFQHLAKYAVGGAGTVMTEALIVDPVGRNTYGDLGIWSDDHVPPLARIAGFVQEQGSLAAAQLHHAGPKSSRQRPWEGLGPLGDAEAARGETPWQPVAASDGRSVAGWHQPRAMTTDEIARLVEDYGRGAARVARAGYDVLDIHAAHGYLIHSFLSPVSNTREDRYGGDRAGRMRFALEIAESVRAHWPSGKPLLFRISCVDWRPDLDTRSDGWTIEDSIVLARELAARGVDVIDCSSGGIRAENSMMDYAKTRTRLQRGHQVPYAEAIRRETGIPTMAVGVILDGPQAEAILQAGQADLIAIGREALTDPHWALHAAQALGADPDWRQWPPSYGWWLELRERIGIAG